MKKICILDVDMTSKGGVEAVTATLANGLSKQYEVYVLSMRMEHSTWAYNLNPAIKKVNFTGKSGPIRIRQMYIQNHLKIRRFLKKENIEVMLLMGTYMGLLGSIFCVGTKTKAIFCDHGALMNQWDDKAVRFMRWFSSKFSNYIVTLTNQTMLDYIEKFHISPRKIECIYNGIEDEILSCKKSYNINSKCIISAGRFGKEKGYDMLVEVAKIVLPKHKEWSWHLYGEGETFEYVESKIREYHLEKQLILKGQANDLKEIYGQYAFLVLPSYREGLPLVLLEAKAIGLPLVSFDVMTGPREIITDGEDGILVKPKDVQAMAIAIELLIDHDEERLKLACNAGHRLEKFEMSHILEKWHGVIEKISV